jgi:hypothetical protein
MKLSKMVSTLSNLCRCLLFWKNSVAVIEGGVEEDDRRKNLGPHPRATLLSKPPQSSTDHGRDREFVTPNYHNLYFPLRQTNKHPSLFHTTEDI